REGKTAIRPVRGHNWRVLPGQTTRHMACSESSYWLTDSRECGAKASPASRCLAGPANGPGQIAPYRLLVGVVQRAVFGAVPAVAVVLKLVVMPGDTRPLDCGTLVIIHMPSSHPMWYPLLSALRQGRPACLLGLVSTRQLRSPLPTGRPWCNRSRLCRRFLGQGQLLQLNVAGRRPFGQPCLF